MIGPQIADKYPHSTEASESIGLSSEAMGIDFGCSINLVPPTVDFTCSRSHRFSLYGHAVSQAYDCWRRIRELLASIHHFLAAGSSCGLFFGRFYLPIVKIPQHDGR
jgi:hypothetical protein